MRVATGMFGANVEELMELAGEFERYAGVAEESSRTVASAIDSVAWMGADAVRFTQSFGESIPSGLNELADLNIGRHDHLGEQAETQVQASLPGSGGGCLEGVGDFLKGVFVDGLWGDIKGIVDIFTDPIGFLKGLAGLVGIDLSGNNRSWWETFSSSWGSVLRDFFAVDMWGEDPARALGKVLWNVGSCFIPGYNVAKIAKILRKVDVPDAPPAGKVDAPEGKKPDTDTDTKSKDPEGGPAEHLPPGAERLPDGSIKTSDGRVFDPDHQVNGVDPQRKSGTPDPRINRDVTDPNSTFKENSMYTTSDGQTFITNDKGLVEYSSITRKGSELPGDRSDIPGPAAKEYAHYDVGDERGHHNPDFMGGTNDNINLTEQSPGANRGVDRPGSNGAAHQQVLETRTRDYMEAHPDESITWERRTHYDDNGHAVGYEVRVSGADGKPIDLSNGNRDSLKPNDEGWTLIED